MKKIWGYVIIVVVTAGIVGGGVFAYNSTQNNSKTSAVTKSVKHQKAGTSAQQSYVDKTFEYRSKSVEMAVSFRKDGTYNLRSISTTGTGEVINGYESGKYQDKGSQRIEISSVTGSATAKFMSINGAVKEADPRETDYVDNLNGPSIGKVSFDAENKTITLTDVTDNVKYTLKQTTTVDMKRTAEKVYQSWSASDPNNVESESADSSSDSSSVSSSSSSVTESSNLVTQDGATPHDIRDRLIQDFACDPVGVSAVPDADLVRIWDQTGEEGGDIGTTYTAIHAEYPSIGGDVTAMMSE